MSDEYENSPVTPSLFWPLLVLLVGLLFWSGYQVFATWSQKSLYNAQYQSELPTIQAADNWRTRYNAMMKDLIEVGGKDATAAPIARGAIEAGVQAGLIRVNQNQPGGTNTTANPAAPAPAAAPAK